MTEPDDDLAELLCPKPASTNQELLKATILRDTTRRLQTAQRWRFVRRVVGVLAVFAGGVLCGWFMKPIETITVLVPTQPDALVLPALPLPEESVPTPPRETAQQLEIKAELADDRAESANFYRMAGDRYLKDFADYGQAARCYKLHLNAVGPAGRDVSIEDEWLLMSMKLTQNQEMKNALRNDS